MTLSFRRRWPWAVRVLVLSAVMASLRPPPALVVLGPPQTVATRHPIVCTHTRLTDEVEPWKVLRTVTLVREMGAPTIVEYFPWAYHEGQPGRFEWSHAALVVDDARNQGLAVIARLSGLVPAWARVAPGAAGGADAVDTLLPEARFADFGEYVYQFVRRFRGQVRAVIIWNEPNVALEWGFRRVDPEAYTRLLRIAYTRASGLTACVQRGESFQPPSVMKMGLAASPWATISARSSSTRRKLRASGAGGSSGGNFSPYACAASASK